MSQRTVFAPADLFLDFYALLGSKIHFKTVDGEYEGILKLVLPQKQRVTFEHVYYVPTRDYMGNLHFFFREFLSYKKIDDIEPSQKFEKWDYLSQILNRKYDNNHFRVNDLFDGELDETPSEIDDSIPCCDEDSKDDYILQLPHDLKDQLPVDSVILDSCNEEFDQAIAYILRQSVIGVALEGPKISRFGKLSWVCISSPDCIFLFDIERLGNSAFQNGLKSIFENKSIEKVFHDCRQASDCLLHKYQTELINVFDTQAADFVVNLQRYSDKPKYKYVSSLDCCLVNHLKVPQEFLHNRRKHISIAEEEIFFKVRPVSHEFRDVLIKNVLYLILLKNALFDLMMSPFRKTVDVYLKVLSNASEPELLLEPSVPDKVPPALVLQGVQTVRFQEFPKTTFAPLKCNFKDPASNKIVSIKANSNIKQKLFSAPAINHTKQSNTKSDHSLEELKVKLSKVHKNADVKVVDELCLSDHRSHLDRVYHHLVNNASDQFSAVNVDVKPSNKFVSNFTVKQSFYDTASKHKSVDESETDKNAFADSSDTSVNTSMDSEDSWSQLRSAFGVSCSVSKQSELGSKKIKFLPAGMCI